MVIPDYITFKKSNELYHYGIKGKSGRYPLGSGERPYQDYPEKRQKLSNREINKKIRQLNKAETIKEESAFYKSPFGPFPKNLDFTKVDEREAKAFKDFDGLMNELVQAGVPLKQVNKLKKLEGYVYNGAKFVKGRIGE